MRSKISFFNGTIFKKNFTHYWPIWVLFLIYLICQIPIRIFGTTSSIPGVTAADVILQQKTNNYFNVLSGTLQPMVCFAGGMISAMAVFHYMYFQRNAQAYHSFPVRREELFFTNYISGFLFYTLPLLFSFLLGACICAFRGITAVEYLFVWFLLMEGMCFFFYNMTILVGMFTGQFFVVPLLTFVLNYLYIGCRSVVLTVVGMISYGLSDIYSERLNSFLSPLGFMIQKVNFVMSWDNGESAGYLVNGCCYVVIYAGLGLIFGITAFFMYKKRRIESVGDMVVICLVRPVFRWVFAGGLSLLLTVMICGYLPEQPADRQFVLVLPLILGFGILAFFIAEALLQRKVKIFSKKRLLECACYTVLMAAFLICVEKNVFGLENRLPDSRQIASARVDVYYPIYTEDKQEIAKVLDIHKQVIASKKEFEEYQDDQKEHTMFVRFCYKMKDGTPFIRNYVIPASVEYLEDQTSVAGQLYRKSCEADTYFKGNFCINYKECSIQDMGIDVCDENDNIDSAKIEPEYWDMVWSALETDIREGNIINNQEADYGENNDFVYWNSLSITLHASNGVRDIWNEDSAYSKDKEGYYTISFNRDCVHLIEALRQSGAVNDTDRRILTWRDYYDTFAGVDVMTDYEITN